MPVSGGGIVRRFGRDESVIGQLFTQTHLSSVGQQTQRALDLTSGHADFFRSPRELPLFHLVVSKN